jgi:UDP-N-acetylmuramyl pentapeptide phosphotransferase/UDP-N-acetylglucosamine-1-phosphate transferase
LIRIAPAHEGSDPAAHRDRPPDTEILIAALVSGLFLSALASMSIAGLMLAKGWLRSMLDEPGARSLHDRPVPRTGGVAVHAGWAIGAAVLFIWTGEEPTGLPGSILASAICLFALSLADDRFRLPVAVRLPVHLACALWIAVAVTQTGWPQPAPLALVSVALALAWGINLYNFMDGANGLAGGMTAIGFGTYAAMAGAGGFWAIALVCACVSGSALGFLRYNFGRARLFLGDSGSIPLGLLAGAIGWTGFVQGIWAWWTGPLLFFPFVADATVTLALRLLNRRKFWQPHREHLYQRLILTGWSHTRVCSVFYPAMLACAILCWMLQRASGHSQAAALAAVSFVGVAVCLLAARRAATTRCGGA